MSLRRAARVALVGLVAVTVAACPGEAAAPLTDPHEIIGRTIDTTSTLRTFSFRVDVEVRPRVGQVTGGTADGVVDLANTAFSIRGAANAGNDAFEVILVDRTLYSRQGQQQRWTGMGMDVFGPAAIFGPGFGGPGPDVLAILRELITHQATTMETRPVEGCAAGSCYRVNVFVPAEVTWASLTKAFGFDRFPDAMEMPADFPGVAVDVLSDTRTLRLVDLVASASVPNGDSGGIRLQLADPNGQVTIQAPPPALVDRFDDFGMSVP
jgi:hypothetical protein